MIYEIWRYWKGDDVLVGHVDTLAGAVLSARATQAAWPDDDIRIEWSEQVGDICHDYCVHLLDEGSLKLIWENEDGET